MNKAQRNLAMNTVQISYLKGCSLLQRAVWRLTHEDPLYAMTEEIESYLLREVIIILMRIRKQNSRAALKRGLHKWIRNAREINSNGERLRVLLKLIFKNYDSKIKSKLSKYLYRWRSIISTTSDDILRKYGALFEFLEKLTEYSLAPAKIQFLENLYYATSPESFKNTLGNCLNIYQKHLHSKFRRVFNTWRLKAKDESFLLLKHRVLRLAFVLPLLNGDKQLLRRALRKWYDNALTEGTITRKGISYRVTINTKIKSRFRRTREVIPYEVMYKKIIEAKEHMLRHNINKNGERLFENLKKKYSKLHSKKVLKNLIVKKEKRFVKVIVKKHFKYWFDKCKELKRKTEKRNMKLRLALEIANNKNKNKIREILRKKFLRWKKNAESNNALPNTFKACDLIRKASISPFFQKIREKIMREMRRDKFRTIIKPILKKCDENLLHWWLGQWRTNSLKLKAYDLKAILSEHFDESNKRRDKLRTLYKLRNNRDCSKVREHYLKKILSILINKFGALKDLDDKGKLSRAIYKWKSNIPKIILPKDLRPYDKGIKLLRRFTWRATHEDVLYAFDEKITGPAVYKLLTKLINAFDRQNKKDLTRKKLYQWRINSKEDNGKILQKLRDMFDRYLFTEPIRKQLMSPYKDLVDMMKKYINQRDEAGKKIKDYFKGIALIPEQVRRMKLIKYFYKFTDRYNNIEGQKLRAALLDWIRRTRVLKSIEDSQIIQKFCKSKLEQRLRKKRLLEEFIEKMRKYILQIVFNKIYERAQRKKLFDLLKKLLLKKGENEIKKMGRYFRYWKSLLPNLKKDEACTLIQSAWRGYNLRKKLERQDRIKYLLINILGRLLNKNYIEPSFQKWRKNAKKVELNQNAKIIQDFCKKKLAQRLKDYYQKIIKLMTHRYIFKVLSDLMKKTKAIKPEDIDKLVKTLKLITVRKPFDKLINNLKWKIILNKVKSIPDIYDKFLKLKLKKYLEDWNKKGYLLPNQAATKIQNAYRAYLAKIKLGILRRIKDILNYFIKKNSQIENDKKLATLMKWNKNSRLVKCIEDSKIIQNFCKRLHNSILRENAERWKQLIKRIVLDKLSKIAKFIKLNKLIEKAIKRNFIDKLKDLFARKKLQDLLKRLLKKYDDEAKTKILRDKFDQWRSNVNRLKQKENDAAIKIQRAFKNYLKRKILNRMKLIKFLLENIIKRIQKKNVLPTALRKWSKNARLIQCIENSKIIQDFCKRLMILRNREKYEAYLKLIKEGLDKLKGLRLGVRWAWDKIKDGNKKKALENLIKLIQTKINQRNKDTLDEIKNYAFLKTLRKLIPFRENWINNILRKKLNQWNEQAKKLGKLQELQDLLRKKIMEFLRNWIINRWNDDQERMRYYLKKWLEIANEEKKEAAARRIARYLNERYRLGNARKNWKDLTEKLRNKIFDDDKNDLLQKLKEYLALKDMTSSIKDKILNDGWNQLKDGNGWLISLKKLRELIDKEQDRNNNRIKKKYLLKWIETIKKLRDRNNKIKKAFDEMDKRQKIIIVKTLKDVYKTKKIKDSIPVARAYDFFNKLRDKYERLKELDELRRKLLRRLIIKLIDYLKDLLRKKLNQWKDIAKKNSEEIAKCRISRWIEQRYRISQARKNWKDLCDKYYRFMNNKDINEITRKIRLYLYTKDMTDKLAYRFKKTGKDQFVGGVDNVIRLKFLRVLIEDQNQRNRLLILSYYLKKWKEKTKKLKEREEALIQAMDTIDTRRINIGANSIKDSILVRGINSAIPVARAYDFIKRIKLLSELNKKYTKLREDLVNAKNEVVDENKEELLTRLYKMYYYKIIDKLFNILEKLGDYHKKKHIDYFLNLLRYIALSRKNDNYKRIKSGEFEPKPKKLGFKGKSNKFKNEPEDRNTTKMLLPSFIRYLSEKFLSQKRWAFENILRKWRATKFAELYKKYSNRTIVPPKRDLVDMLKSECASRNGLGAIYCDLFKLLRRYWIKLVCDSMLAPSRVYKIQYLIKMVMMHKAIQYQRFIRELVRKWRFSSYVLSVNKKKLELMYKNLHVTYLKLADEMFGNKEYSNASVTKEFERFSNRMGMFTNEDTTNSSESFFCEKIKKKYIFQPMKILVGSESHIHNFSSGIEIEDSTIKNEDYYVDQDLFGETTGNFRQSTNKSSNSNSRRK